MELLAYFKIAFITEGQNFKDSIQYLSKIDSVVNIMCGVDVRIPPSWLMVDPWLSEEMD